MRVLSATLLATALSAFAPSAALGQQCPKTSGPSIPSEITTLEGNLVYHDGIRKWFELKLDQPQCGQSSTELTIMNHDWIPLEILRGCHVSSKGALDLSPTGYYTLETYQNVDAIAAAGPCKQQSALPKELKADPDKRIRAYRVDMHVNYTPGDHPIRFRISSAGKELHPWQAYASYFFTGGFVLYGNCGDGFAVDHVFGTPQAHPSRPAEDAAFDPESAAAAGTTDLHLSYTCVRVH
jgi:hypothetical protein